MTASADSLLSTLPPTSSASVILVLAGRGVFTTNPQNTSTVVDTRAEVEMGSVLFVCAGAVIGVQAASEHNLEFVRVGVSSRVDM